MLCRCIYFDSGRSSRYGPEAWHKLQLGPALGPSEEEQDDAMIEQLLEHLTEVMNAKLQVSYKLRAHTWR